MQPQPSKQDIDWETVYQEQMPRIYNFFRYRVGDDPLAEDLTATTFEKAWQARSRYRHNLSAFSTWLFTIARNTATDHFRQLRQDLPLESAANTVERGQRPVEESLENTDDLLRLTRLLSGLTTREREIIALKYGGQLTNRTIAELLNLSESNVGTILNRLVQRLREKWEEAQPDGPSR